MVLRVHLRGRASPPARSTEEIDRIAEAHFEAALALIVSHEEHE